MGSIGSAVQAQLKDPESARFSFPTIEAIPDGMQQYCGIVNAKNSFNGYTGNTIFMVALTTTRGIVSKASVLFIGDPSVPLATYETICQTNPVRVVFNNVKHKDEGDGYAAN